MPKLPFNPLKGTESPQTFLYGSPPCTLNLLLISNECHWAILLWLSPAESEHIIGLKERLRVELVQHALNLHRFLHGLFLAMFMHYDFFYFIKCKHNTMLQQIKKNYAL